MGRRGPAPTPTSMLKLRGSTVNRPLEPETDGKPPVAPEWMTDAARIHWEPTVSALTSKGVLDSQLDGDAVALYCQCLADYIDAQDKINRMGATFVVKGNNGDAKYIQQSPFVGIRNKLLGELRRYQQEFGMTPASRARVEVDKQQQKPSGVMSRKRA